jgi:broad-specificity NMP kinase
MFSSDPRSRQRQPHRPLLTVEFVGTPGAGKTTLADELVDLLQEDGINASTVIGAAREHARRTVAGRGIDVFLPHRLRRAFLWQLFYMLSILHIAPFTLEHFRLIRFVLRTQLTRPIPFAAKRHVLFWFFQLVGRGRFLGATSRGREIVVVDDGFLHRSVHLNASHVEEPDARLVRAYVDLAPTPDVVVVAVAGRQACERRIQQRGVWQHRSHLSPAELSRYIRNAEVVVGLAVQRARERGWTVLEVDNEGRELDQVRKDLREAVVPLLAGSSCMDQRYEAFRTRSPRRSWPVGGG